MRYGVKYQPLSGEIHAGTVRHDQRTDREVFIAKCDVTGQAIGAVALWLIAHSTAAQRGVTDEPYQITNRKGQTYELSARIVTGEQP